MAKCPPGSRGGFTADRVAILIRLWSSIIGYRDGLGSRLPAQLSWLIRRSQACAQRRHSPAHTRQCGWCDE
jgi:hypothetical protein